MATLYELQEQYNFLVDMASDPEVDPQVVADTLEGLQGEIADKADAYAYVMQSMEMKKAALKAQKEFYEAKIAEIDDQIAKSDKKSEGLMAGLLTAVQMAGKANKSGVFKLVTEAFSFSTKKGSTSVDCPNEKSLEGIPEEFIKTKVTKSLDKTKLKEYLKDHPDCEFAKLVTGPTKVTIK